MHVLLTGATGLIGKTLGPQLVAAGHKVYVVSRSRERALKECLYPCEVIEGELVQDALRNSLLSKIEAVIHLAGENIASSKWTEDQKRQIYNSRVKGTKNLVESLKESPLKVFVSTSASGFYGDRKDEILLEDSPRGSGFLADVCQDWERPVILAERQNLFPQARYVILRLGLVLSSVGGALEKMIPVFKMGLGGHMGNGKQWMSWIDIRDLAKLYLQALSDPRFSGIYNAVSPQPLTNREFSQLLAQSFGQKARIPVPGLGLKLVLGEMADLLLHSQRMEAQALVRLGFEFQSPTLEKCFENIRKEYESKR